MKILSPAGNFECLKAAIFNGADEVYLGVNDFNARNNIDGFNMDNLKQAVDFAHIFCCKVNLAINILFNDDELQNALNTIIDAYNLGVDTFIIQDIALANLVNKHYPEIEIHASTQMGIHNLEGAKAIEQFGFKRIVLARETPLSEIKRIKDNTNFEIEYFAQGALCVSFSGNCYLSSYLCNASGNRGRCKQLCRLPYTLLLNNKPLKKGYLLSAKDFNMIKRLDDLKKAGVDVIKIEGRARRPFYVAAATQEYYKAINKQNIDKTSLQLAFNRDYTEGYFNGNTNIISNFNNHIGIKIGIVDKFKTGKKFNEVYFYASRKLSPKSTLKFLDKENEVTITAYDLQQLSENYYKITTTQRIPVHSNIHLINDTAIEEEILSRTSKRNINIEITAIKNNPIKANINLLNTNIEILGEICQESINQPLKKEEIIDNFKKSEYFNVDLTFKFFDDFFITKQKLNEFRRNVLSSLFNTITKHHEHHLSKIKINTNYNPIKFDDFYIIENVNTSFKGKNIIYSPSEYSLNEIKSFIEKCNKLNKNAYLDTPNFALKEDVAFLNKIINETGISIVANNYYALTFKTNIIIGYGLNVYNKFAAEIYKKPILTAESNIGTKISAPVMTLRHCPLKEHLNANCANCPYSNNYTYKMDNGTILNLKRKKLSSCTFYLTMK